jgi:senataxin
VFLSVAVRVPLVDMQLTRAAILLDPNQLPPTVLSQQAQDALYNRSLFLRIQEASPSSVHLLRYVDVDFSLGIASHGIVCCSIQYRMHPEISVFPSKRFYESRLKDGPEMDVKTRQAWHANPLLPPYAFFDVRNSREERGRVGHTLFNRLEAEVAVAIYARLQNEHPEVDLDYRVGVVTPYKGQVGELRRQFRARFGDSILSKVDFNTVDGFQGQEKTVIILSCVRGGDGPSIGFLKDIRRMNVALTRAVSSLFILGNSAVLEQNSNWKPLIEDARERRVHREVSGHVTYSPRATNQLTVYHVFPGRTRDV